MKLGILGVGISRPFLKVDRENKLRNVARKMELMFSLNLGQPEIYDVSKC